MPGRVIETVGELRSLVGEEVGVSGWYEIPQEKIDGFAELTEDRQWIHIDRERANMESPYQTTIGHGFLTLSMLSHLSREAVELRGAFKMRINYGLNKVRFPAAVPAGAKIRARFAVGAVEDVEGGVQVIWKVTVETEGGGKPVCAAEWVVRAYY
ncbi:MAG: MaoC family dehydratase [Acidimicrobiia bacterium]|nr:MaoC family dehydratase [Acidimicrobiia bacterium]